MIIKLDKYFVEEMNRNGFECDYSKLSQIYKDSRNNPEVMKIQKKKLLGNGALSGIRKVWNGKKLQKKNMKKRKQ